MVKSFCEGCKHKDVSVRLKKIFNSRVQNTFVLCPIDNEDVIYGCFMRTMEINWSSFEMFCIEKGFIKDVD